MNGFSSACRVAIFTAVCLLGALGAAQAQPPPSGKELSYVLDVADHPALGEAFQKRIEERLRAMLQTLLGYDAAITRRDAPDLTRWLLDQPLDALTGDDCRQFGLGQSEKTIILRLDFDGAVYQAQAAEFDRYFDSVGRVHRVAIGQRELVPDGLGRLSLRCWSPVGEIAARVDPKTYLVRFPEAERLTRISQWSRLAPGAVLQPIRDNPAAGPAGLRPRTDQFLIVSQITPRGLECNLALSSQDPWFNQLGRGATRYWVRRLVPTQAAATRVEVLFKDSITPREGCEVSLSQGGSSRMLGHTDSAGRFFLPQTASGLLTVAVRFEGETITRACFPGVTPSPLVFRITPRDDETDRLAQLRRLETSLADTTAALNDIVSRMNAAVRLNDIPRMKLLLDEARQSARFEDLKASLSKLSPDQGSADFQTRAKDLAAAIDTAEKQADLDRFQESLRTAETNILKQTIAKADEEMRWADAQKLLEEYTALAPGDNAARARLDELTAGLAPKDPPHAAARLRVDQARNINSIEDLLDRWTSINNDLELLLANRDTLWLTTAAEEFDGWLLLVNNEASRIQARVTANNMLPPDEESELKAQAAAIQSLATQLKSLVGRVDRFLAGP